MSVSPRGVWNAERERGCFIALIRSGQYKEVDWGKVLEYWPVDTHNPAPTIRTLNERIWRYKTRRLTSERNQKNGNPGITTRSAPQAGGSTQTSRRPRENRLPIPPASDTNSPTAMPCLTQREKERLRKKEAQFAEEEDEETRAAHARARAIYEEMNGIRARRSPDPVDDEEEEVKRRINAPKKEEDMKDSCPSETIAFEDGMMDERALTRTVGMSGVTGLQCELNERLLERDGANGTASHESGILGGGPSARGTRLNELFHLETERNGVLQVAFSGSARRIIKTVPQEIVRLPPIDVGSTQKEIKQENCTQIEFRPLSDTRTKKTRERKAVEGFRGLAARNLK